MVKGQAQRLSRAWQRSYVFLSNLLLEKSTLLTWRELPCHTKAEQLHKDVTIWLLRNKQVAWLDVSMNNAPAVNLPEGLHHKGPCTCMQCYILKDIITEQGPYADCRPRHD